MELDELIRRVENMPFGDSKRNNLIISIRRLGATDSIVEAVAKIQEGLRELSEIELAKP